MIKIIILTLSLFGLTFSGNCLYASEDLVSLQEVIRAIAQVLPKKWNIHEIDCNNRPYWSFSDDTCIRLQVYGPLMGGYDYYSMRNNDKRHITRWYYTNESRLFWIVTKDFEPGWTITNRIRNRLSKTPVSYPERIFNLNGFTIYGEDNCSVVLHHNEDKAKKSPPGTNLAEPINVEEGGSWPTWIEDVRDALKNLK